MIGWPAPNKKNTGEAHGATLGADEVAATKKILDFDPDVSFQIEEEALARARQVADRGKALHAQWNERFDAWTAAHPERKALLDRLAARGLPDGWTSALPIFEPSEKGVATRKASGEVLNALAPVLPELWGGSADLAGSNDTTMKGEPRSSRRHETKMFPGHIYGRTLHFGIREHGMGAIINGIAADGLTRPVRRHVPDLQRLHARRGPAGRPVQAAVHLRLDARLDRPGRGRPDPPAGRAPVGAAGHPRPDVVRPADANETTVAWRTILERTDTPAGLCLTRQNVPCSTAPGGPHQLASAEGTARGGYVLAEAVGGKPDVILIGTGSEVQIALAAREILQAEGIADPGRLDALPGVVR